MISSKGSSGFMLVMLSYSILIFFSLSHPVGLQKKDDWSHKEPQTGQFVCRARVRAEIITLDRKLTLCWRCKKYFPFLKYFNSMTFDYHQGLQDFTKCHSLVIRMTGNVSGSCRFGSNTNSFCENLKLFTFQKYGWIYFATARKNKSIAK